MRILLVNAHGADLSLGGSERYVADLAHGLTARAHEIHVLSAFPVAQDAAESTRVLHSTHWRTSRVRRWRNHVGDLASRPTAAVRDAVVAVGPDVVHTSNLPGISTGIWETTRRLGVPLVHTLHDYHLLCPRSSLTQRDGTACCPHAAFCGARSRRLARWQESVSAVMAGSQHLLERVGSIFTRASLNVIRLPIVPVADRALRPPSSPPRVLAYLGGLDPVKGVRELVESAPSLAGLGLRVHIAGDGRLRELVEHAAARSNVVYRGPVGGSAKLAFIEEADAAVVPSVYEEPCGPTYVVAEWIAAGRPVLTSTRGGLVEAQHLPGLLPIEPTASGIADGAGRLVARQVWEQTMTEVGPVTDSRDLERWLDEHEAVYSTAVT